MVEFLRSSDQGTPTPEVKLDLGGEDTVTGYHFSPAGTDAPPRPGDVAYLGEDLGAGNAQAVGYQDPINAGVAAAGEHRVYSRDADGAPIAELWLKADGSILVRSVAGGSSAELAADGAITLTTPQGSAALAADGAITLTTPQGSAAFGADGAITLTTPQSSAAFGADGAIDLSNALGGVAIDAAGNVVATTPLGTFGAGTHTHASPFGPTGPPIPGT